MWFSLFINSFNNHHFRCFTSAGRHFFITENLVQSYLILLIVAIVLPRAILARDMFTATRVPARLVRLHTPTHLVGAHPATRTMHHTVAGPLDGALLLRLKVHSEPGAMGLDIVLHYVYFWDCASLIIILHFK